MCRSHSHRRAHTLTHKHTAHYSTGVTATSAAHAALPLEADQSVLPLALMDYRSGERKEKKKGDMVVGMEMEEEEEEEEDDERKQRRTVTGRQVRRSSWRKANRGKERMSKKLEVVDEIEEKNIKPS